MLAEQLDDVRALDELLLQVDAGVGVAAVEQHPAPARVP